MAKITDKLNDTIAKVNSNTSHRQSTANPHGVTKAQIGLGNVDNTSDAAKPVSTAAQTALNLKANLESPALTGTPTVPTAAVGTNTTQIASTAYVFNTIAEYAKDDQIASEVPVTPVGNLTSINVQDALEEIQTEVDANTTARHTHSNKAVLDATTASYTTAEKTKVGHVTVTQAVNLDAIETNSNVSKVVTDKTNVSAVTSVTFNADGTITIVTP